MAWSDVDLAYAVLKLRDADAGYGQTADAVLLSHAAQAERIVQQRGAVAAIAVIGGAGRRPGSLDNFGRSVNHIGVPAGVWRPMPLQERARVRAPHKGDDVGADARNLADPFKEAVAWLETHDEHDVDATFAKYPDRPTPGVGPAQRRRRISG